MYIIYCRYIVFKININSLSLLKKEPTQLKKVAKSLEELTDFIEEYGGRLTDPFRN